MSLEDAFHADVAAQDLIWMEKIKQGDTAAFEALIEAHQHKVLGMVAKMLGDQTDHEDIAQQVFIRIWKSAHRYHPTAKFTTWLFKITRNLVFNELRRRKRHPSSSLDDENSHFHLADDRTIAPNEAVLEQELQQAIQKAIDALPELQRMALVLRRYEEMPYEQIADVLEITVPAVKSLLFRARTELRTRLHFYLHTGPIQ